LDVSYLTSLSDDAIPALAKVYRSASLPSGTRQEVGAALACYAVWRDLQARSLPWQSFHFSRWKADRVLQSLGPILKSYQSNSEDWSYNVTTPAGKTYPCWSVSSAD
jgi:hypothetical protein